MNRIILCPIDFSVSSVEALQYAVKLAESTKDSVSVLYSYRLQPASMEGILEFKKRKEDDVKARFKSLEGLFTSIPYKFIIEIGFLSDSIDNHIRKNGISALVMNRKMCSALNDHKEGAMEEFFESLTIPVVIIPEKTLSKV